MTKSPTMANDVEAARKKWLAASEKASQLAAELFQPESSYGDQEARSQDEHRLQTARHNAEHHFQEYHDLDRRDMELKMLGLQRSQSLVTWASFAVAAVVRIATIVKYCGRTAQVSVAQCSYFRPKSHSSGREKAQLFDVRCTPALRPSWAPLAPSITK